MIALLADDGGSSGGGGGEGAFSMVTVTIGGQEEYLGYSETVSGVTTEYILIM
jgi:hypothetical protein